MVSFGEVSVPAVGGDSIPSSALPTAVADERWLAASSERRKWKGR